MFSLAFAIAVSAVALSLAQQHGKVPTIWDLELGMHARDLPARDFVDTACGTENGPPSRPLAGFEAFAECPPEATGLHRVWFRYDDEMEYRARAIGDELMIQRYTGTQILGQPVNLSVLFDEAGILRGFRVITDPRADLQVRLGAYSLEVHFRARYAEPDWDCVDLPRLDDEQPVGRQFIKRRCEKIYGGDRRLIVETHLFRKPGQAPFDPHTRKVTEGQFESSARLEVFSLSVQGAKR